MNKLADLLARYTSLCGLLLMAWYAVFEFPYLFPPAGPLSSNSYDVGFSNMVAVMAVVFFIGLFFLRRLMFKDTAEKVASVFQWSSPSGGGATRMGVGILLLFCVVYAGLSLVIGWATPFLDSYGESQYFVGRVDLLLHGFQPYRDVQFVYGPLFIYLPAFIARVGHVMGWSVEQSYLLFLIIAQVCGLCVLFYFVNRLRLKVQLKVIIFSFISLTFVNYTMGVQCTLIRYFLPYALLFNLRSIYLKLEKTSGAGLVRKISVIFFLFALAALMLSPEVGIIYVVSQAAYCVWMMRHGQRTWWPLIATLLAMPVCLILCSPAYLMSVLAFGGGAANFPVVPSIFILFYLGSLFCVVPLLMQAAWKEQDKHTSALMVAIIVLIMGFLPAALGRCDPGHVTLNGAAALAITLAVLGKAYPRKCLYYIAGYAVVGVFLSCVYQTLHYKGGLDPVLAAFGGNRVLPEEKVPSIITELKLSEYPSIMTPLGIDKEVERYLRKTGQYRPAYYNDFLVMVSPGQVEREIETIKKAPILLVPANVQQFKNAGQVDAYLMSDAFRRGQEMGQRSFLSSLQLIPMNYRITQKPYSSYCEIGKYIAQNFNVVRSAGGYSIMSPKAGVMLPGSLQGR